MGIFDKYLYKLGDMLAARVVGNLADNEALASRRYYAGIQRRNLNVKVDQFDDNLTANLCGVIADRAVSQLVGGEMKFNFESGSELSEKTTNKTPQEVWLDTCLSANHWDILRQRMALAAAIAGTGYITFQADSMIGEDGQVYPRIILMNSELMCIETLPDDWEIVQRYIFQYKTTDMKGKEIAKKRVYENDPETGKWVVYTYESAGGFMPNFQLIDTTDWAYPFAPVLHWQNLPSLDAQYGKPEIGPDGYEIQDRINAVQSNMSKLIRLFAHPMRYTINAKVETNVNGKVDIGPDQMPNINTDATAGGGLFQLPVMSDLSNSMAFVSTLRRTLFDITRTVDLDSLEDKLGQITNFGLKVLYQDNQAKIDTKQEIFGEMIEEMGRRLFIMGGIQPQPFDVVWSPIVPVNEAEQTTSDTALVNLGVMSKQTVADRAGLDWEEEQLRIEQETQVGYERLPAQ